ncbi:MAG TPA: amidohydrolase family protein [Myxococcales bacterium]|jgi:imidazolonepropionase-like amidohydrolase
MLFALLLLAAAANVPALPSNVPALPDDVPKTAQMYDVQMLGKPAGQFAVWQAPDGKLHSFFQYNDRGRGPKIHTTVAVDSSSVPLSIQIEGNDYMKDAARETFSLEGGTARWKNKGEDGSTRVAGPAFYTAMAESPFEAPLLVQALRAHGGRLALLPGGEARLTKVVTRPEATLYAVTGLDFSPSYVWIGNAGELFAQVGGWMTLVKHGEEARAEELKEAQKQARSALEVDRVRRLAHKPKGKLLFHDAAVFDSETARLQPHHDVLIEGNRIVSVTPTRPAPAPQNASAPGVEVIEANGKTLLPGLFDMHAHVSDDQGILNLAAGVTSVRDLANDNDELYARIQRIERGQEVGTRIFRAGFMDGPGPFQGPTKVLVATPEEALHWVDWYADHGFIQVKLYSSLKPELVPIIAEEAHRRGLRVSGHIPSGMFADECIRDGYDEIQHVNFLMLNFLRDVKETNGRQRFTAVAERGAGIDMRSPEVQKFVELLRDRHTTLDPTLSVFENMLLARPGAVPPGLAPLFDRLPVQIRRGALAGDLPVPEGMDGRYRESFQHMLQLVHEMWQAGVPIEAGTDALAGFALERELELDVAAGIPTPQVLQLATFGAARIIGQDSQLGAIRQGRLADLVLVDGDPSQHISDIRKVVLTVKDGVVYNPAELDRELGVRPL